MKNINHYFNMFLTLILMVSILLISACSEDKETNPVPTTGTESTYKIYPCYEGTTALPAGLAELVGNDLVDCSQLDGMVCNTAVSTEEECIIASQLYPEESLPFCGKAVQIESYNAAVGTCQFPDVHGTPCSQNTNCSSGQNLICFKEGGAETGVCQPEGSQTWTRLVYIYRRLPDLTSAEFLDYWLNDHAPLVVANSEVLGIKGYLQLHTAENPFNASLQSYRDSLDPYDGVGEYLVDLETFTNAVGTPEGLAVFNDLIDDKKLFADMSNSAVWLAEEHLFRKETRTQTPGEPVEIFTWLGTGIPSLTSGEFQDYYLNHHGLFPIRHHELLGVHEYIQIHTLDTSDNSLNDTLQTLHGTAEPYYVHLYSRWDFNVMMAPAATLIRDLIFADEPNFADFTKSAIWITEEHIIISAE